MQSECAGAKPQAYRSMCGCGLKAKLCRRLEALEHARKACGGEGRATLANEDEAFGAFCSKRFPFGFMGNTSAPRP